MTLKNNRGEVMIEAAIYLPFVFLVLFVILALNLMLMNQIILDYEVSRVADQIGTNIQYDGYEVLSDSKTPSFQVGLLEDPTFEFFEAYHQGKLQVASVGARSVSTSKYTSLLAQMVKKYSIVNGVLEMTPTISIKDGYTDVVDIKLSYRFNEPRILRKLIGRNEGTVALSSTRVSMPNMSDNIRRVDAARRKIKDY